MPAVPLLGLSFQAPRESAPNDRLLDSANHVEPRPIAPATTKDSSNPMSSRTFGPASAGTLGKPLAASRRRHVPAFNVPNLHHDPEQLQSFSESRPASSIAGSRCG